MRLGQLARKLNIKQLDIAKEIEDEFKVTINMHPNVKLDDSHVEFLIKKHQPEPAKESQKLKVEPITEPVEKKPTEKISEEKVTEEISIEEKPEEVLPEEETKPTKFRISLEDELIPEDVETIKAPKVELDGPKVLDKIDLPEPPKPREKTEEEIAAEEAKKEERRLKQEERKERQKIREEKKKVYEGHQKRKAEKKKIREEEHKKQQKKQNYLDRVQEGTAKKKPQPKKKKAPQQEAKDTRPKPKSIFGRFWRWLTTA